MTVLQIVAAIVVGIPVLLVLLDLFWFGGRCPRGGAHEWGAHPAPYLSASWVRCAKCGGSDF